MEENKLYEIDSTEFNELLDSRKIILKGKNEEYRKLTEEFHKIMNTFPNLQLLLEDNKVMILDEIECKMLQKLVAIYMQILDYEEREIFFLGAKENYFYFKNLGLIKE